MLYAEQNSNESIIIVVFSIVPVENVMENMWSIWEVAVTNQNQGSLSKNSKGISIIISIFIKVERILMVSNIRFYQMKICWESNKIQLDKLTMFAGWKKSQKKTIQTLKH